MSCHSTQGGGGGGTVDGALQLSRWWGVGAGQRQRPHTWRGWKRVTDEKCEHFSGGEARRTKQLIPRGILQQKHITSSRLPWYLFSKLPLFLVIVQVHVRQVLKKPPDPQSPRNAGGEIQLRRTLPLMVMVNSHSNGHRHRHRHLACLRSPSSLPPKGERTHPPACQHLSGRTERRYCTNYARIASPFISISIFISSFVISPTHARHGLAFIARNDQSPHDRHDTR